MKKLNFILMLILLSATSAFSQDKSPNVLLLENDTEDTSNVYYKNPSYKSPGLAFFLSFLITGTGQVYNGDVSKGITQFVMVGSGIALILYDSNKYGKRYDEDDFNAIIFTGSLLIVGGSLWSIIDAPVTASKKNKEWENNNTFGHLMEFDSGDQIVGFDLGYRDKILGGKVTLHF